VAGPQAAAEPYGELGVRWTGEAGGIPPGPGCGLRALRRCGVAATVGLAAAVALGSCASGRAGSALPRTPQSKLLVTMDEYRLEYKTPVPSGRVVFRVVNAGRRPHRLTLLPLPEDVPPIDQQLRGHKRRVIAPLGNLPELAPGSTNTFAVDLAPDQRYALIDFSPGPGGRSNALLGMTSEFHAEGAPPRR
jgi:hypothetical protein